MRFAGTFLQLMLFSLFIAAYAAAIIPAAMIVALRRPAVVPAPRAKTTIGTRNGTRIY